MNVGFVCGAFDLLHAGHLHLIKECRKYCDRLYIGIQVNPANERLFKHKPYESLVERQIKIAQIKGVYSTICYESDKDLSIILKHLGINIRFLGSDYIKTPDKIKFKDLVSIHYIDSLPIHTGEIIERIKNS